MTIAIFSDTSNRLQPEAIFPVAPICCKKCEGAKGFCQMQRVCSLLRAVPTQAGRRLARFLAIAAASLPDVGA